MSIRGIRRALRIRFTRRHVEREVDDEFTYHVERRAEQLRAAGMSPEQAYAEARRRFGDLASTRDACVREDIADFRRTNLMTFIDHALGDLRFAWRSLKRAPAFTAVALTTLVVGIASVTSIFSFVYAWAFRPLPYKDANRIVAIEERRPRAFFAQGTVSVDAARAISIGSRSFERIAIFTTTSSRALLGVKREDLATLGIDSSFTAMFGVQAQIGRTLTADEIERNDPVAMISDVLWRTSFGADPSVVGRAVRLGDELITITGVMPPGFRYPVRTNLWRPIHLRDSSETNVTLLGRLAPGTTRQAAANEMAVVARRLAQSDSQQFSGVTLTVQDMIDRGIGRALPLTALFIGAGMFVLLIACSNVANLLLVRAAERRGEMAVRSAMGAGRARLFSQALTESVVLATVAGAVGAGLSVAMVRLTIALVLPDGLPSWLVFGLNGDILLFTIVVVSIVTLGVGLIPAREGTRFDLVRALKLGGDGGVAGSNVAKTARRGIVVQLALSVVLFVGASLMVQTYRHLAVVDVGYPDQEIVSLYPFFDLQQYPTDTLRMRFVNDIFREASTLPGARFAAVRGNVNALPLSGIDVAALPRRARGADQIDLRLFADGDTARVNVTDRSALSRLRTFAISDSYFQTLGLRIVRGRGITADDFSGSLPIAVVSRRLAEVFWPKGSPLGRTVQFGLRGTPFSVVGVVEDVRDIQGGPAGIRADRRADAYFSVRQVPISGPEILIRGSGDVGALQAGAQSIARRIDPNVVTTAFTMARDREASLMSTRIFGLLMGGFAISGLVLSIIGIYGVVAYGIAQRTREIGIRIALGGTSRDVMRLILRDSLKFVTSGLAVGIVLSLGASRLLRVLIFGVSTTDPLTYVLVCVLFGGVALLACYLPTRRVARVDPLVALRAD